MIKKDDIVQSGGIKTGDVGGGGVKNLARDLRHLKQRVWAQLVGCNDGSVRLINLS